MLSNAPRMIGSVLMLQVIAQLGCVEMEEPPDEGTQAVAEQEVVLRDNWDALSVFDDSRWVDERIVASYGRAVAWLYPNCTGVLINDQVLATAHHCRETEVDANGRFTVARRTATFGRYPGGTTDGRNRLYSLGLNRAQVEGLDPNDYAQFHCEYLNTEHPTDIDLYECQPNTMRLNGYDVALLPGHVWGHMELDPGTRSEGTDVYVVSHPSSVGQVRLSPFGEVTDSRDGCILGNGHSNCFEHNADSSGGSSGGAILDSHFRLFGLVHGGSNFWQTNYGSYVSSVTESYYDPEPTTQPLLILPAGRSSWVGTTGGTGRTLSCNGQRIAIGVVATSVQRNGQRVVGNFGLVCGEIPDPAWFPLDTATVLTGGSQDVLYRSYNGDIGFNRFINEGLYSDYAGTGEHQFLLCPPGFSLTGMAVQAGGSLTRLDSLTCTAMDSTRSRTVSPRLAIGGDSAASTSQVARCPARSFVNGIRIRSGALTSGFALDCAMLTSTRVLSF